MQLDVSEYFWRKRWPFCLEGISLRAHGIISIMRKVASTIN